MNSRLKGIFSAVWVPVRQNGGFDDKAFLRHFQFLKKAGIHGLMVMGSTGEFVRFEVSKRKKITEHILAAAADMPTIVNVTHAGFSQTVKLAQHAREAGATVISAMPPYFFKTPQADLAEFFVRLGEAADIPLMLYNYPEVAGTRIEPETIRAVCERIPVAGLKQSGNDFEYHSELAGIAREKKFALFSGFDTRLAEAIKLGAVGGVSGLSNAVPELLVRVYEEARKGGDAKEPARLLKEFCHLIDPLAFPINIAAIVEARGFTRGYHKLPVSAQTEKTYKEVVEKLRSWIETNLPPR
jgi:4-hydroxy-tetrahydrodipicolinate synthase